jgi:putative sterol carrier protein
MTIDELFAYMRGKADQVRLDNSERASIILNISGANEERRWLVSLKDGRAQVGQVGEASQAGQRGQEVSQEASLAPDVDVSLTEETLLSLANGQISPIKAFLLGRIKIKGDSGLLGRLKYLWPET